MWGSPGESIWSTVVFSLFFGVALAAFLTYGSQATHKALTEAVAGLDKTERSQAIAAVTRGVVPADPTVRSSAIRLGTAYLGNKSAAQLKRGERQNWIVFAFLIALAIAMAVTNSTKYGVLFYTALALLLVAALLLGVLTTRRVQRNVALLSEGTASR